jgi:hypothetical protein
MRRTLVRPITVGVATALVAAAASGSALAAKANGHAGPRAQGIGFGTAGFGFGGGPGNGFGPPGFGSPGAGLGAGASGGVGPGANASVLGADILDPAASYLGISLSTLESDLAGGQTLSQLATATSGKTTAGLISAIVASETTVLDAEKAAGWITATQESSLVTSFTSGVTGLVNNGPPVPPSGTSGSTGLLQTAATFLGVSLSTLQSDLQSGKTLADVATAQGDTAAALVTALEAPAKTKLDAAVTAGTITAAQETTILNQMTTRLTNIVNGTAGNTSLHAVRTDLALVAGLENVKHR